MSGKDDEDSRRANRSSGDGDDECHSLQSMEIPGTNSIATPTGARSSSRGLRRHITRKFTRGIQAYQQDHNEAVISTDDILQWDDGQVDRFKGLTPPPLTPDLLPGKKRSIRAILGDNSPPRKDKMSEEIDKMTSQANSSPSDAVDLGSQAPESDQASGSHQQKKVRLALTMRGMGPSNRTEADFHRDQRERTLNDQQSEYTREKDDDSSIYPRSR
ncbi:hypothetical protein F5B20DRAFT_406069 [Whalleya microplaca]|nr:hypothetical protein F5B20DRAFT_406069 [Whalleya microplaca]